MLQLPLGCRCSKLSVYPKNWNSNELDPTIDWYINYRFYDPSHNRPKQVILKGMNRFKQLDQRRSETLKLLQNELDRLRYEGYNPFLIANEKKDSDKKEIDSSTSWIQALETASGSLQVAKTTLSDIRCVIKGARLAAERLRFISLPIGRVTRKHIKQLLIKCGDIVPGWTANRFNKYRSYLKILFTQLIEMEVIDFDPTVGIRKQKVVQKLRQVLTEEERKLVDKHLRNNYYEFWRFVQIFFHSGARERELMQVRKEDVDLANQRFRVILRKGGAYRETWKVIKSIALPFWSELYQLANSGDFLFSLGLNPGRVDINPAQITRRWRVHVKSSPSKGGLGITADFYSLKHLHTTEIVDLLSVKEAAKHNSHASTRMTQTVYDIRSENRSENSIIMLNNPFSKA